MGDRSSKLHGLPAKFTIDKSGANAAAVHSLLADSGLAIELRQSKYLNNLVEQDHMGHQAPSPAHDGGSEPSTPRPG